MNVSNLFWKAALSPISAAIGVGDSSQERTAFLRDSIASRGFPAAAFSTQLV
jgi:hypothetical protein